MEIHQWFDARLFKLRFYTGRPLAIQVYIVAARG